MKRLFSILLCLVMCFGCSLTAFAGGPIPDISNNENEASPASTVVHAVPPGDLKFGVTYRIRSMASMSLWLNVDNGTDDDKTPVTMRSQDADFNTKNQKFWLISAGSYFMLGAACSTNGRVLDAYRINGELKDGCSVDIWSKGDDPAQHFVITGDSSSGYLIRLSYYPTLVLTAIDPKTNGSAVQFKTYTGEANQRWYFADLSSDHVKPSEEKPDPKPDIQNKNNWCWATSAKIVTEHNFGGVSSGITTLPQRLDYTDGLRPASSKNAFGSPTANGVQRAIVIQVKGNDMNYIGKLPDMEKALEFAQPGVKDYITVGKAGVPLNNTNNQELFKSKVQSEHYVMAGFTTSDGDVGHVIVITGYDPVSERYSIYDPWTGDTNTSILASDIFKYKNTLNGISGYALEYFFYCDGN